MPVWSLCLQTLLWLSQRPFISAWVTTTPSQDFCNVLMSSQPCYEHIFHGLFKSFHCTPDSMSCIHKHHMMISVGRNMIYIDNSHVAVKCICKCCIVNMNYHRYTKVLRWIIFKGSYVVRKFEARYYTIKEVWAFVLVNHSKDKKNVLVIDCHLGLVITFCEYNSTMYSTMCLNHTWSSRVLNGELYAHRFQKLICLHLLTDCFMKISPQSLKQIQSLIDFCDTIWPTYLNVIVIKCSGRNCNVIHNSQYTGTTIHYDTIHYICQWY